MAKKLAGGNKEIISFLIRRQEQIVTPHLFPQSNMYDGKDGTLYYLLEDGDDVNPVNQGGDWLLLVDTRHGQYTLLSYCVRYVIT